MQNGFLGHNSGSRHARMSIKSSKDADDHLVTANTLSQKMSHCPGPGKVGQKFKHIHILSL